jgi:hypothetical protein
MEISSVLVYFLKVIAIQGVFFAFYWLVLKNRTNHGLNRVYLLSTLLLSLVIPFIENPFPKEADPILEVTMLEWMAEPMGFHGSSEGGEMVTQSTLPIWGILSWVYLGLMAFFIGRSSLHLIVLQKIKKQCEYVKKHWFKLFKTPHSKPFSFFSSVFIPKEIFGTSSFDQILAHECVHVRQLHSLDRLLVDFLVSLFWFNPFIYLYRKALIEVHEFQADAEVVKQFADPIGYQEILFAQLQPATYSGLVSHFNFSTIKKRIVMMNKSKNASSSKLAYALVMPLMAMVLFAFTSKESEESVAHITEKIEELTGPFSSPVLSPEKSVFQRDGFKPSILPLKTDARFKMTSSFGMRTHPITKEKQHHRGIDLAVAVGAEVLATADGVVEELSSNANGYGHMITINHGGQYNTRYSQLSEFKVENGDKVKKGQVIALSGNSGKSTGPHLHYEVYEGEAIQNPMSFIKNYKFTIYEKPKATKASSKPKVREVITEELVETNDRIKHESKSQITKPEKLAKEAELHRVAAVVVEERAERLNAIAMVKRRDADEMKVIVEEKLRMTEEKKARAEARRRESIDRADRIKAEVLNQTKIRISSNEDQPIFILDGKVLDKESLNDISPIEIKSIEVIKGESAIEKYGEEGRNGVIEITRKEGKPKNKKKEKSKVKD